MLSKRQSLCITRGGLGDAKVTPPNLSGFFSLTLHDHQERLEALVYTVLILRPGCKSQTDFIAFGSLARVSHVVRWGMSNPTTQKKRSGNTGAKSTTSLPHLEILGQRVPPSHHHSQEMGTGIYTQAG